MFMGGMNSGRRPKSRNSLPQVEDALILDIPLLRAYDAFTPGASGVMQWADGRACMQYQSSGENITFSYTVKERNEVIWWTYSQCVKLTTVPLSWNNGTSRPALFCPECGRRGYKLYLSRKPYFLCRVCQGLIYEAQTIHFGGLAYQLLRGFKEERKFHEVWKRAQARKGKNVKKCKTS